MSAWEIWELHGHYPECQGLMVMEVNGGVMMDNLWAALVWQDLDPHNEFSVQMREFLVTFGMERYIESTWSNKFLMMQLQLDGLLPLRISQLGASGKAGWQFLASPARTSKTYRVCEHVWHFFLPRSCEDVCNDNG